MTPNQVIAYYGSAKNAAEMIYYTPQAINGWRRRGKIPLHAQKWIQSVTRGKLKARK